MSTVGRYVLHAPIARGGMATVHAARLVAAEGVTRLVAAKRLHPQFIDDPDFVAMFHDEARIASRIHHPNVVPVLDVVREGEEVILVQEYVHGVPLSHLFRLAHAGTRIPIAVGAAIIAGVLAGLHAAHEATDEAGDPLGVVHRDVSPQNVIVSIDGIPRLLDFGIAKARTSVHHTREGVFKGKLAYMPSEQFRSQPITRQADIYASGVLLWEILVNRRFYDGKDEPDFVRSVTLGNAPTILQALERRHSEIPEADWAALERLEPIVTRALATNPEDRFASASEMAAAIVASVPLSQAAEIGTFVRARGAEYLEKRRKILLANDESFRTCQELAGEDSVRSSGARFRLAASDRPTEPAPTPYGGRQDAVDFLWRGGAMGRRRAAAMWAAIATLLVVTGLLLGMLLGREPAQLEQTLSPLRGAPAASGGSAATSIPLRSSRGLPGPLPEEAAAAMTTAPQATRPSPPAVTMRYSAVASPPPPSRPATHTVPPIPTPIPTPTPTARVDCNPPYYFEGSKKVFKSSCL
jgi:serine/threonine-protein kinase